jgi:hypothetical protein
MTARENRLVNRLCSGALIAATTLAGCGSSNSAPAHKNPLGDAITQKQYTSLKLGQDEQTIVNRLQQSGKPEDRVAERLIKLFPRHDPDAVACSYWQVAGDSTLLVRLCFSSPAGKLVQKLERRA